MKPVAIYTTETCSYCKLAKEFFQKNHVEYQEFDVGRDLEKRQEMIDKSGQMGVPVITVGEDLVVGFNKPRLEELLSITEAE
jgi:glutaredoxin-like YruB-family protein